MELQERADLLLPELPRAAPARLADAVPLDEDADEPARGRLLLVCAVPPRRGPGDAVRVPDPQAQAEPGAAPPAPPAGRLPPRGDGEDASGAGRRVRHHAPAPDRPAPDADREQRGLLAAAALAARAGRRAPHPEADVRLSRAARLRPDPHLQPLALGAGAPAARQPEPGAEADVLRALAPTAARRTTSSTTSRRATRSSPARRRRPGSGAPPVPA